MPVVEAFAHGLPVLCAEIPSLVEVAGGAALHTDPSDVGAIAAAMVRIHRDAALRASLRTAGLARARALSPEASAAGWLHLHREVMAVACTS